MSASISTNGIFSLANQVSILDDGWAMLAPFGEYPGVALSNEGARDALQIVDKESAEALIRSVRSLTGKASRFFREVPIFNGHPDVPQLARRYSDRKSKGHVADIQIRDNGIYVRPVLNDDGATLVNSESGLGLSAYVRADVVGERDGKLLTRWNRLISVALTKTPNLPVDLINSQLMQSVTIIAALVAAGVQIANDADDAAVVSGIKALQDAKASATQLANERLAQVTAAAERATQAETALANERGARITELLDERVTSGAITEAERPVWERRLKADFANEAIALRGLKAKVHTQQRTANAGDRRGSPAGTTTVDLMNAEVSKVRQQHPEFTYHQAFIAAARQNPELFAKTE